MKKILILLAAIALLFTSALAQDEVLYPVHDTDMETLSQAEDVRISTSASQVDDNGCIYLDIYGTDLYEAEGLYQLQIGDKVLAGGEEITVQTLSIDKEEGIVEINGSEPGYAGVAVFYSFDEEQKYYWHVLEADYITCTFLGQAYLKLADEVTITSYQMTEDGELMDEDLVTVLPASQVRDYMQSLEDEGVIFNYSWTYADISNDEVVSITVCWSPAC